MYSASHVDPATTLYLELHQLIAPPFNINMYPDCDLESSGSVKACINVTIYNELFVTSINEKHILSPFQVFQDVLDRCPVITPGLLWYLPAKLIARHTSGLVHSIAYMIEPMAEA